MKDEDILKEARARFREAMDADSENRADALDDLKFLWDLHGYQWDRQAREVRRGRPMLTENRLPQYVRQVVNSQRRNRPAINLSPADGNARKEIAAIKEGLIRHIERWSRADLAYDNAFESAVSSGIGYFRITTEYVDEESDDKELCIRPIENAFSVYDDPRFTLPDGSDRRYCFVTEWVNRPDFEAEYGFEPSGISESGIGDDAEQWFGEDRVQVAEYWRVVKEGRVATVEQYLMTGDKIIRKAEWPGKQIPIIPVYGEVKSIEGKKYRKSLIRDAKEPQKINNYFLSAEVESTALQPRAPWIGPTGAFETDIEKWSTANAVNHAYLQYDPVEGAAQPMRVDPPQFPAALRETRLASIEAMKAIMGIYDASLGARSNETSGVAIDARAAQGDIATYHYIDNMTRAIRYAGNVLVDLMPHIYDAPRVVRILAPDDQEQMVAINQAFIDPMRGREVFIPMNQGRYDVVVKAGPSFQTQRQETAAKLSELARNWPEMRQVAGDLLAKNLEIPEADKIAERLRPPSELPPQVQQQMQAMQQQMQQMGQQMQQMQQALAKAEIDIARKELEKEQKDTALQAERAKAQIQAQIAGAAQGDNTGAEIMRLQEENAKQGIELAIKELEKKSLQLQQQEHLLRMREEEVAAVQAQMVAPEVVGPQEREPGVMEILERITQAMMAPREIVRGPDGRAMGVRPMMGA